MLDLREDLEEVESEVSSLRLRMLWLMSQEVRRERQEASKQLIIQYKASSLGRSQPASSRQLLKETNS